MDLFMQKAMAKSPMDRYSTPREFINALEQLQQRVQASLSDIQDAKDRPRALDEQDPKKEQSRLKAKPEDGLQKPTPSLPKKQARLLVVSSGQAITLSRELMVVGRQDPVLGIFPEINLADKTVGRRHAYLRNQHGQYTVEDLNALNKTRLNGEILTPYEERALKDGDVLRFGSVEVRFELR
jgi:serine/threonine-protein kinase